MNDDRPDPLARSLIRYGNKIGKSERFRSLVLAHAHRSESQAMTTMRAMVGARRAVAMPSPMAGTYAEDPSGAHFHVGEWLAQDEWDALPKSERVSVEMTEVDGWAL